MTETFSWNGIGGKMESSNIFYATLLFLSMKLQATKKRAYPE
jgi:hypothetical protein